MRSTFEIQPQVAERLQSIANANKMSVEELLNTHIPGLRFEDERRCVTPEEAIRALDEWISEFPEAPPLSDEAVSRESIYGDR